MTFTSVSLGRLCSPMIMPSYTSTPGHDEELAARLEVKSA
jgi:hypothetical protein